MPQTKSERSAAARKGAATRKSSAAARKGAATRKSTAAARKGAAARKRHAVERKERERASAVVDRSSELSDEVLKSLESGQRAAIEAVRKFVDTVDQALPAIGERPSRRQEIVDAAMEMADRLVHTQYDFLRKVVQDAGKALGSQGGRK